VYKRQGLPRSARSEDDLDALAWWGFAARTAGDAPRARAIAARLAAADPAKMEVRNPALPGHALRLLADPAPGIR